MAEKKEKFRVAPPYADRKPPKGMEFHDPIPPCPRCMRTMTWRETDSGALSLWCFHCQGSTGESI